MSPYEIINQFLKDIVKKSGEEIHPLSILKLFIEKMRLSFIGQNEDKEEFPEDLLDKDILCIFIYSLNRLHWNPWNSSKRSNY
jgi:hypothetical protein